MDNNLIDEGEGAWGEISEKSKEMKNKAEDAADREWKATRNKFDDVVNDLRK